MLNAQFRPLSQWPGKRTDAWKRKDATFRASYPRTLDLLEYELGKLGAQDVVIQVEDLTLADIRNDGWPRGGKTYNPDKPGVVLSFASKKGPLALPCDRYRDWQDNLRAIALSLEALRAVDRYGVTQSNEQYRGWTPLADPKSANGKMTRDEAARFLAALLNMSPEALLRDKNSVASAVRVARVNNHPDRGGSHETFVKIGQAEQALSQ
jgi:hypothetical protein